MENHFDWKRIYFVCQFLLLLIHNISKWSSRCHGKCFEALYLTIHHVPQPSVSWGTWLRTQCKLSPDLLVASITDISKNGLTVPPPKRAGPHVVSVEDLDEGSNTVNPSGGEAALIRRKIYVEKAVKQGRWEWGVVGTKGQQSHQQLCHHHSFKKLS